MFVIMVFRLNVFPEGCVLVFAIVRTTPYYITHGLHTYRRLNFEP